jgi:hypothetical protein
MDNGRRDVQRCGDDAVLKVRVQKLKVGFPEDDQTLESINLHLLVLLLLSAWVDRSVFEAHELFSL